MARRHQAEKRPTIADAKFNSALVSRLINVVMRSGKKSTAQRIVYGAFERITEKNPNTNPLEILQRAMDNAKPRLEVKPRRVGGATYQVPMEVRPERRVALGMRWLVQHARTRGEKTMRERLAAELVDASALRGGAVKKKDDTHRMADANKAFAHYRW